MFGHSNPYRSGAKELGAIGEESRLNGRLKARGQNTLSAEGLLLLSKDE